MLVAVVVVVVSFLPALVATGGDVNAAIERLLSA